MGIDLGRFKSNKNDEWVDWLADDPVPPSIRQKMRSQAVKQANRPVVRRPGLQQPLSSITPSLPDQKTDNSTVSINISIPKFKINKPSFNVPAGVKQYRNWLVGGVLGVVLVTGAVTIVTIRKPDAKNPQDAPAVLSQADEKPSFNYSLPDGKAETLDTEVQYDAQRKVVNYKDSIGGIEITISQQPLPEGFKDNPDEKVKKLAEDFSANKTIATSTPTAYIGTSEKGPQTVIFTKKDLLVFIQSTKKIDDIDWAEYITKLK